VSLNKNVRSYGLLSFALAFIVLACSLVGNDKVEQKFSFTKTYDTLAQFDSVTITLRDTSGRTIDVLYRGKADTVREIESLGAPHWDGSGIAVLSIEGFQGGIVVYRVDKKFNGKNDQILDTLRLILPGTALAAGSLDLTLTEGDSLPLPAITVTPVELSDKTVLFVSSAPQLLQVGSGFMRALQRGSAKLTGTLKSNPSKSILINVTILANPLTPDSLFVLPDTLRLAADGAPGSLSVRVSPSSADPAVTWIIRDATLAQVVDGSVLGLKAGTTFVVAASKRKTSISDSAVLIVGTPVPVAQVRFPFESMELFVGGVAESLMVEVLPASANPKTELVSLDPTVVAVIGGRVKGLSAGATKVIARSVSNPAAADTLAITVFPVQHIDSVAVSLDTLRLFTGGTTGALTAKVYPASMNQTVLWRASNPAIATVDASGKTLPKAPGVTQAIAFSRADSTKKDSAVVLVKRDMPQVSVGRDTVVPLGSTLSFRPKVVQEYGTVTVFRWDLNGDGTPDGSSDSVKTISMTYTEAKETVTSFYVKDSEGNDTTVYRKIKAVSGQAVQILEPADSTYTRFFSIDVKWTVNSKEQDSLKTQTLVLGKNTVTRSARDEGGNPYSATVTVFVDTTPPNKPLVHGPAFSASKTPTWTWASGGGGGNGSYKYWLDVDDSSKGKPTTDTSFISGTDLAEGTHTLFVAERDQAGNWSGAGRWGIKIDFTLPGSPLISVTPSVSPTNVRRPVWNWSTGGNGGIGSYQYKLDDNNLSAGTTQTTATTFTPATNLSHGSHTLYVQEKDSTGNWSVSAHAQIIVDTIPPVTPLVSNTTTSPTNSTLPIWSWTPGGGGRGTYRAKVGDTVWIPNRTQTQTSFTPDTALTEGTHFLYMEEQDSAGNWSPPGSKAIRVDLTKPGAPVVSSALKRTINQKPTWSWTSSGNAGAGYRIKLNNPDLSTGATTQTGTTYSAMTDLPEGFHTLYVQEKDTAGNWSENGSFEIEIHGLTGYAIGGEKVFKTTNGGVSWAAILTNTDPEKSFLSVFFTSKDTGNIVGGGGFTSRTVDGGQNWIAPLTGVDANKELGSVWFPTSRIGYASAKSGWVYKTSNGGVSWSSTPTLPAGGVGSIHFPDANTGYVVSAGGGLFKVFKTTDGGMNWNQAGDSITSYGGGVFAVSPSTVYAVGDIGIILKSTNGGSTWSSTPSPNSSALLRVAFPTSTTGYAVGYSGAIIKTTNSGATWASLNSETNEIFYSIHFLDANYGFVGGTNGTILKTTNGGASWTPISTFTDVQFNSIYFP
jgi:photosystem II stability/assembly factor-like uncharacterized protein